MKKLIVVMDLGCLKGFRVSKDELSGAERIEVLEEFENPDAHARFGDKVTDQAGRFPGGSNGHGVMSQGEKHLNEQRKRLLRQLTERLHGLLRREGCDIWHLGASREINHRVLESLDADARSRLRKNLAADLTKIPPNELLERFRAA
jgi:hypothetical protein